MTTTTGGISPPAIRDYLLAQYKIITVCGRVLGSGSLSYIKLATFARFTHTVYGFSLGKQGGIWLRHDYESGQYCFGYRMWDFFPGRVADKVSICNIVEWAATRGYGQVNPPRAAKGNIRGKLGESEGPLLLFKNGIGLYD